MKTSNNKRELIIKKGELNINIFLLNNKIYLTKKEIAKLFGVSKVKIKKTIEDINEVSNIEKENNKFKIYNKTKKKNQSFYSIEFIISIGYRLKSFESTKFLLESNKLLKEYNINRRSNLSSTKEKDNIVNKFFNIFLKNKLIHI